MKDNRDLFTYHCPFGINPERFILIRHKAKELQDLIELHGGNREDKDRSILKLRETVFYAIASIAIPEAV